MQNHSPAQETILRNIYVANVPKTENLVAILPEAVRVGANAKRKRSAAHNGDNAPKKQATVQRRSTSLMEGQKVVKEYTYTVYCFLFAVKKFCSFRGLLRDRENF